MARTIYAAFPTVSDAERAAGAIMDHGVNSEDISFIVPERAGVNPRMHASNAPRTHSVDAAAPSRAPLPDDIPNPDVALPAPPRIPIVLDEAMLPRATVEGSRLGYRYDALGAAIPDVPQDGAAARADAGLAPAVQYLPATPAYSTVPVTTEAAHTATIPGDTPADIMDHEQRPLIVDINRDMPAAASGVTTTTAADAAKGALGGAGIGIGMGILLGLAALAIPGVGWVAGTGALVTGLAAATGAAGGVAGGVYGYLADLGLPADTVQTLHSNLESGGPVLSVTVTGQMLDEDIIRLMRKYGATSAEAF